MGVQGLTPKYPSLPSWENAVTGFFDRIGFDPTKHGCAVVPCPPGRNVVDAVQAAEFGMVRDGLRVPAAVKARPRRQVDEALVVVPMGVFLGLVTGGEL